MMEMLKRLCGRKPCRARHYDIAVKSERGLVRADNQDNLLVCRERSLFCVADGMGGGQGGAEASAIACKALDRTVKAGADFSERIRAAGASIHGANCEIREFARKARYSRMATTVTVLSIDDEPEPSAVIAYVGDSRVYRLRDGKLEPLTHDHTLAGELSRRPSMRSMIARLGWREGQLSHVLTRAVGIEPDVQPDWRKIDVRPDDVYLLCTDGVYDMVDDKGIEEVLAMKRAASEIADELERRIILGGAIDNYTMIVLRIKESGQ
ncbi:MAG: protein phosphatase 2C domain-containing protein [Kiritimatiellae bacterium]|nr:protein phosphatase 2C domain-containing protein [Kiritimatiellia bacterium]